MWSDRGGRQAVVIDFSRERAGTEFGVSLARERDETGREHHESCERGEAADQLVHRSAATYFS